MDFRNVILIMTSNLGSQFMADPSMSPEERRNQVMAVVKDHFRPEFLNRLDEIVLFDELSREDLDKIVDISLDKLNRRLAERRISIDVSAAAREWLARTGYDPVYGARPLRRLIQTTVEDQLARAMLAGTISDDQKVSVDMNQAGDGVDVKGEAPVSA